MEISETDFFDIMTIQNDEISYVKHALAPISVFHPILGVFFGGGAPKGSRAHLLRQFSSTYFPQGVPLESPFLPVYGTRNNPSGSRFRAVQG